jgi:hypothetical protein
MKKPSNIHNAARFHSKVGLGRAGAGAGAGAGSGNTHRSAATSSAGSAPASVASSSSASPSSSEASVLACSNSLWKKWIVFLVLLIGGVLTAINVQVKIQSGSLLYNSSANVIMLATTQGINDTVKQINSSASTAPTTPSVKQQKPPEAISKPLITGDYVMEHVHSQISVQIISNDDFRINYIWSPSSKSVPLKGVVLLLHGCSAQHLYWWYPKSATCGNCSGRPMEAGIVKSFYQHGYVTISSEPLNSKCWNDRKDMSNIGKIVSTVYTALDIKFKDVPLYGMGIANGAKFVMNLASESSLFGGVAMAGVVCLNGGLWDRPSPVRYYSPVLFVDMARNVELCMQNNLTVSVLLAMGHIAKQFTMFPLSIGPTFFSDAGVVTEADSRLLQRDLLRDEVIWPGSLILLDSPFGHTSYKFKDVSAPLVDFLRQP